MIKDLFQEKILMVYEMYIFTLENGGFNESTFNYLN